MLLFYYRYVRVTISFDTSNKNNDTVFGENVFLPIGIWNVIDQMKRKIREKSEPEVILLKVFIFWCCMPSHLLTQRISRSYGGSWKSTYSQNSRICPIRLFTPVIFVICSHCSPAAIVFEPLTLVNFGKFSTIALPLLVNF